MSAEIYRGTTYAEYLALPGYRWSEIKQLHSGGPIHVLHARTAHDADTARLAWLRAVHCLTLEPHTFDREYSVYDGVRRGAHYEAHLADHPGTSVLKPHEAESARALADAIRAHPLVAPLLAAGDPEVVITWTDPETRLRCKARLDWLAPQAILDLKTLGTTHEGRVARMVAQYLYHGQLAHYTAGLAALGIEVPAYLVVAEDDPPHDVALYGLDPHGPDGALYVGGRIRSALLRRIAECEATGRWPGRHEAAQDLVLPLYALDDSAEEIVHD